MNDVSMESRMNLLRGLSRALAPLLLLAAGSAFAQAVDIPAILDADLKAPPTSAASFT